MQSVDPTPFGAFLGVQRIDRGEGRAFLELELRSQHLNRRGVAHGGVISSLLDMCLGAAVISAIRPEEWCGTIELTVHFIAPARPGSLRVAGHVIRRGTKIVFAEGQVEDPRGRILATARGTWTVWPGHPDRDLESGVIVKGDPAPEMGRPQRGQ